MPRKVLMSSSGTRRITVFYQNRRQTMSRTKTSASAIKSRRGSDASTDAGVFGEMMGVKSHQTTPLHGHGRIGPVKLNGNRGIMDENWKWTPVSGPSPMPTPDMIEKLAIVYAIITGELDAHCYYHQYITNRAQRSSRDDSSSASSSDGPSVMTLPPPVPYSAQMYHRLEDIIHDREAELPGRKRAPPRPQYDENGTVVNLTAMLPTDPPSEGLQPIEYAHERELDTLPGHQPAPPRSQRGERVPDFAMRHEHASRLGRVTAMDLYRSSSRAKALAKRGDSTSPFARTMSLPSLSQALDLPRPSTASAHAPVVLARPKPLPRGARQSYPSTSKPIVHTRPRSSFSRSQSAMDIGTSRTNASSSRGVSPCPTDVIEEEEQEQIANEIPAELSEAAELLMGMSRSTDSGSGSGSSQ